MSYLHCSENQDFRKTENKKRETKKKGKMKGIDRSVPFSADVQFNLVPMQHRFRAD